MGFIVVIILMIALPLLAFGINAISKIVVNLDYLIVLLIVSYLIFGDEIAPEIGIWKGFFSLESIHPVFFILSLIAPIFVWWLLQQITVFGIYVFRILGSALAALVFVALIAGLLQEYYVKLDLIWSFAIGIVYFIAIIGLRFKDNSLLG